MNHKDDRYNQLRQRIGDILSGKETDKDGAASALLDEILEEMNVYQEELECQNDELLRIQEELQESKQHFEGLFNDAPVAYVLFDKDGVIQSVNSSFARLVSQPPSSINGESFASFIAEKDQDTLHKHLYSLKKNGRTQGIQVGIKGTTRILPTVLESNIQSSNRGWLFRSAITDISVQVQMHDTLSERVKELKCLLEVSSQCSQHNQPMEDILQGICNLLPDSFQYPKDTHAKLSISDSHYFSNGFIESDKALAHPILVGDKKVGEIFIYLNDANAGSNQNPFLPEERFILGMVATQIANYVGHKEASNRMENQEAYYRSMLHALHEDILVIDVDYNIIDVNNNYLKTLGRTRDEVIGRPCYEVSHGTHEPCHLNGEICNLIKVFNTGEAATCHHEHKQADGSIVDIDILMSPLKDAEGNVTLVVEAARDISELIESQRIVKESEAKYRSMFWNNHAVMLMIDPETGVITDANPAAQNYYGWAHSDLCGMSVNTINMLSPEEIMSEIQLAKQEKRNHFNFKHKLRSGEVRDVSVFSGPVTVEGKTLLYSIVQDVTDRKRAEERNIEQKEFLEVLMQTIPNPVFYKDTDGYYIGCNLAFEQFFGIKQKDIIGRSILDLDIIQSPEEIDRLDAELIANPGRQHFEYLIHKKHGERLNVLYDKVTLFSHEQEVIGMLGIITDITEQTQDKEQIRRNSERLESLVKIFEHQTDSTSSLLKFALKEALKLTESKMGCLYLYNEDRELFTLNSCSNNGDIDMNPEPTHTLDNGGPWARVVKSRSELIHNKPISAAGHKQCMVDSDSPPFRFMAIPILSNDSIEAVVGVSSKEHDYTDTDLHQLKLLMNSVWGVVQRMEDREMISKLSLAVEQSSASVVITDIEGTIEYVNSKFEQITGYTKSEAIGQNPNVLKSGYHDDKFYKILWETILAGKDWRSQLVNKKKNGELYWESASISPILNSRGEITSFIAVKEDITDLKLAEEEIKQSEEKLRAIFNNSLQSFAIFDTDFTVQAFNKVVADRAAQFYGTEMRKGMHLVDIYPAKSTKGIIERLNSVLSGKSISIENYLTDRQGKEFWFEYHFAPVYKSKGGIAGVFFTSIDISQRKQAEASMAEALQRERELNELKSRFVSTVSHEFRTPLASIFSNSQLLHRYLSKWDEAKRNMIFERIYESVRNMTGMLENVSLIGKEQSGSLTYRPEVINLSQFIKQITGESHLTLGEKDRVNLSIDSEYSRVLIDQVLLRHIITNLLTNAIKYSPSRKRVEFEVTSADRYIIFTIQDYGVGIPNEDLQYIFEPFFRASNSEEFKGTGLGLSIVKQCVDIHGGEISFDSVENEGTTVKVKLPLRRMKPSR